MKNNSKVLVKNTIMMYLLTFAKLIIPLISLPYLTRVLSVECYGSISFVKSLYTYMQIIVDFGFLLSATKDLISTLSNKEETDRKIGNTLYAQLMLGVIVIVAMFVCTQCFDILKGFEMYAMLAVVPCLLSVFLFEYLFKAYEKMEKIAIRFVVMKTIALILTLLFVKGDSDVILIPIFDIISSLIAIILVAIQLRKMGHKVNFSFKRIKEAWMSLKDSFVYFISNFATTAFTALNTVIVGIMLTKSEVAYWSLTMQLVGVIQTLYNPITTSAFPNMVKNKDLKTIHKIMLIYMPIIFVGCILILLLGDWAVELVFGANYMASARLLKFLIPLLIVSFPAMLYGWPCLGAIEKQKLTTFTTITAAAVQVIGLVILIAIGQFTLLNICIIRCVTETVLCVTRMSIVYKNRKLFNTNKVTLAEES